MHGKKITLFVVDTDKSLEMSCLICKSLKDKELILGYF